MNSKQLSLLLLIVVVCFSSAYFFGASLGIGRSAWDRVAYIGLVFEHRGYSPDEARLATNEDLQEELYQQEYDYVVGKTFPNRYHAEYRKAVEADDDVFKAQLPFYRSRYVYVALLDWLNRAGFSFYISFGILSLIPSALTIIALGTLAFRFKNQVAGIATIPVIYYASDWCWQPYIGSPDALACFLFALGCGGVLRSSRSWLGHLGLLACVSIRPDMALFACAALLVPLLTQPSKWITMASMGASCGLAITLMKVSGSYPLAVLLYHSIARPLLRPDTAMISWTFEEHFKAMEYYKWFLFRFVWTTVPLGAMGFVVNRGWKRPLAIAGSGMLAIALRFLLNPHAEGRYFVPALLLLAVGAIVPEPYRPAFER